LEHGGGTHMAHSPRVFCFCPIVRGKCDEDTSKKEDEEEEAKPKKM